MKRILKVILLHLFGECACPEFGLTVPPAEGYSIALNYRKTGGALSLSYNLLQIINGGWGIGYFISMGLTRDRETHKYLISNHFAQDMRWKLRQRTRKPSSFYQAAHWYPPVIYPLLARSGEPSLLLYCYTAVSMPHKRGRCSNYKGSCGRSKSNRNIRWKALLCCNKYCACYNFNAAFLSTHQFP